MHYERSDQLGRRQRRGVAMAAAVAERRVEGGGSEAPPGFTHMEGSVGKDKVKVKVKLCSSVVVVVSTAVGQTGSSQEGSTHSQLARVKQAKLYAPAFSITDRSVDSHNSLLLLFDLAG